MCLLCRSCLLSADWIELAVSKNNLGKVGPDCQRVWLCVCDSLQKGRALPFLFPISLFLFSHISSNPLDVIVESSRSAKE